MRPRGEGVFIAHKGFLWNVVGKDERDVFWGALFRHKLLQVDSGDGVDGMLTCVVLETIGNGIRRFEM